MAAAAGGETLRDEALSSESEDPGSLRDMIDDDDDCSSDEQLAAEQPELYTFDPPEYTAAKSDFKGLTRLRNKITQLERREFAKQELRRRKKAVRAPAKRGSAAPPPKKRRRS